MPDRPSKTERWLNLLAFLLDRHYPASREEILSQVSDYNDDWVKSGPAFLNKHHLPKPVVYQSCVAAVLARTKADVLELMVDAIRMAAEEREPDEKVEPIHAMELQPLHH